MLENSKIEWPSSLTGQPHMCYESIVPLYNETKSDVFGEKMGFALSLKGSSHQTSLTSCKGAIHKLEVVAAPNFAQASMRISHEVLPGKGASSQLLRVNDKLNVACFDYGCIIPITNFGYKKTFHCDVRGALQYHSHPINCIATDTKGTQLAAGTTDGEISLYEVQESSIRFRSHNGVSNAVITGLAYIQPNASICARPRDVQVLNGENLLIYSTRDGYLGLIDTRCKLGAQFNSCSFFSSEPQLNISTLCFVDTPSQQMVYFGTADGQVRSLDLRNNKSYLFEQNLPEDNCIRRMKEVTVQTDDQKKKSFLVYTNGSKGIKILDCPTNSSETGWTCDRHPEGIVKDFCQVGNRIVTCGAETSIGCWAWAAR